MLELSISQAQMQFTKLLGKTALIVDKKTKTKKAVLLPYEEYERLLRNQKQPHRSEGSFDKFAGVLEKDFKTDDPRYNAIVK